MRMNTIKFCDRLYSSEFETQLNGNTPVIVRAEEFSKALEIVLLCGSPDVTSATAKASQNLQQLIYQFKVAPLIENVADVQMWNDAMRDFLRYTRGLSKMDDINVFIIDWWNKILERNPQCVGDSVMPILWQMVSRSDSRMLGWEKLTLTDCFGDGVEQEWLKAFPCDALFAKKLYCQLLSLGQVKYLVEHGKANYVIDNFKILDHAYMELSQNEGNQAAYEALVAPVTETMLQDYLDSEHENFEFFAVHPLGLKVLHCNEFSGIIARMEYRFLKNGKHFPDSFRISDRAEHDYIVLLNNQLDVNLPVPPLKEELTEHEEDEEQMGYEPFPQSL